VYLHTHTITASKFARSWPFKYIAKLARTQPRSTSLNSLDYGLHMHLQIGSITASKCISKLAPLWPPSLHDRSDQVHPQTHSMAALEGISKFNRSRYGEILELESRQPIINTPPRLEWHSKGVHEKERIWLKQLGKRVRGYEEIPGHDEPPTLHVLMKAWPECVRIYTNCVDLQKLGKSA